MAATEPAKSSSSASGDSYIGSLISLTLKSDIRYEGVLFNINTQDSTIGLTNVRSFGTEGRKRDGLQIPPSDKVYEFILFRGADIKDLQVKSSPPPVQTATPAHSDPAIIQSNYPPAATPSMTKPPSSAGSLTDSSTQPSPHGLSMPTSMPTSMPAFQGSLPQYQPGGNLGSWGSQPNPPTTSSSGLAMPVYWQGYYGPTPTNALQSQQQALLQPSPGFSVPPSIQQPGQYPNMPPAMNASNFLDSQTSQTPPFLMPSFGTATQNMQTTPMVSDSASLIPGRASAQAVPLAAMNSNLPVASSLTSALDGNFAPAVINEPKTVQDPLRPSKTLPESFTPNTTLSSSVLNDGAAPSLVTPGHFLQSGPATVPSQIVQKDVEVVQISSSEPQPSQTAGIQEPLLPLPSPSEHRTHAPMHSYRGGRGGYDRGRGSRVWDSATQFEEEFDFTAMNEKFNKDEVWGNLGKSNKNQDGDVPEDEDDARSGKLDQKPVYVKDDFFDSLSCDSLSGGSRNGRFGASDNYRRDGQSYGNYSRQHGGGGWGPNRGGRSRGGYYGRGYRNGYGYAGRGRGYNMSGRGI